MNIRTVLFEMISMDISQLILLSAIVFIRPFSSQGRCHEKERNNSMGSI